MTGASFLSFRVLRVPHEPCAHHLQCNAQAWWHQANPTPTWRSISFTLSASGCDCLPKRLPSLLFSPYEAAITTEAAQTMRVMCR